MPGSRSEAGSEGPRAAEAPIGSVEPVKQCQTVLSGMGNDNGETLPCAGRRRGSGCGHFLGGGAAGGRLRKACRRGSNTLAPGDHKIVDRLALLDLSMQFEPRMT